MKNIFVFSFVCLCAVMAVADSAYKDVPVQMSTDFEPILSKYSDRSIKKLPYFNEQLKAVTKILTMSPPGCMKTMPLNRYL